MIGFAWIERGVGARALGVEIAGDLRIAAVRRHTLERYVAMKHVLVAPRGEPVGPVDDALRALGLARRVHRSVPYFIAALELVARTDTICTLSERLARAYASRFGLDVLPPPLAVPSYAIAQVWHPRADMDPAHIWLRHLVARMASRIYDA